MTVETIDVGDNVLCDVCNADYTWNDSSGGFIFNGEAVCPECETETYQRIERNGEESFIEDHCPPWQSFRKFVLASRGGDNTIKIIT